MRIATYIICALIVTVVAFIIGAFVSGGFLTSEVPIPWLIVSLFSGFIGCLPTLANK